MLHSMRSELFCPINIQTILKELWHGCLGVYHKPKKLFANRKEESGNSGRCEKNSLINLWWWVYNHN